MNNDITIKAAKAILEYNIILGCQDQEDKQGYIWPCFIGPTGSGKTARAEKLAKELGLKQHKLLLQTMNPEEVGGIPRPVGDNLHWFLDSWAEDNSCIILDELDKPDREHWSTILSLLTDRKLRHKQLNSTVFVAAMQPVDVEMFLYEETGRALSARLCFLPINENDSFEFVSKKHGRKNLFHHVGEIKLPVLEDVKARQLDWLAGFVDSMNPEASVLNLVVNGIVHPRHRAKVFEWLETRLVTELEPERLLKILGRKPELLDELDIATVNLLWQSASTLYGWTEEILEKVLTRISCEVEREQAFNVMRNMVDNLRKYPEDQDGYKPFVEPLTYEQWCRVVDKVSNNIVKYFTAKENKNGQSKQG